MTMKKKANGEGSIRKRPDGVWEGRFYVDGKRKSVYGSTKTEVRKLLTRTMNDVDNDSYIDETNMTVAQWMDTWLNNYVQVRPSTWKRYELDIRRHINPVLGKIKLKELTAMQVQRLYSSRKDTMTPKSIHNLHGVLHNALKVAVNMDLIRQNVTDKCSLPKVMQPEMYPLVDEDTVAFIKAIKTEVFRDLFLFDMFTGLRECEVVGLTWDCIDFSRNTIHVYRQLVNTSTNKNRGQYTFAPLKNGKSRVIEPATQIMDLLRKIKEEQEENKLRLKSAYSNKDNLVFTYPNGRHISNHTVYNHFKKIVKDMGRPQVRFHDLRHTFATLSAANGADMKTVSVTMGHATVAFTLDRYGHVSNAMRTDAANRMTAFINSLNVAT